MIPDYESIMLPLLEYAGDKQEHHIKEAVESLADYFNLTDEERIESLSSGALKFYDRVSWAKTYLKKASLLEYPERGYFRITDRGLQVLEKKLKKIDTEFLNKYPEFVEFVEGSSTTQKKYYKKSDTSRKTMTFIDAAYRVLKENEEPMHYKEITQQALNKGYMETEGKTPEATMSARISRDIKNNGEKSRFVRVKRGTYGLKDKEKEPTEPKSEEPVVELDHEELILHLMELGEINGYDTIPEYSCDRYRLDVVWLKEYSDIPKYCFEVHISGNLEKDIASLKHANDKWNSKIFLISKFD